MADVDEWRKSNLVVAVLGLVEPESVVNRRHGGHDVKRPRHRGSQLVLKDEDPDLTRSNDVLVTLSPGRH